jgi:uncharacterized protein YkwD
MTAWASALAAAVLAAANTQRARLKVPPLRDDARLEAAARAHSEEMLRLHKMSHESPDKKLRTPAKRATAAGVKWRKVAENVAHYHGYRPSGEDAIKDWMGSPEHRANLVDPQLSLSGAGAACDARDCYLTQLFAAER